MRDALRQKLLFDPWSVLGGTMGGMVAIAANCDWLFVEFASTYLWAAAGIGAVGGAVAFGGASIVTNVRRVDDPVEAVGVHAGGGAAGILIASVSAYHTFHIQLLVLAAGFTWVLLIAYPCLHWLRRLGLLRVGATEEKLGLTFAPYESSVFTAQMIEARRHADDL